MECERSLSPLLLPVSSNTTLLYPAFLFLPPGSRSSYVTSERTFTVFRARRPTQITPTPRFRLYQYEVNNKLVMISLYQPSKGREATSNETFSDPADITPGEEAHPKPVFNLQEEAATGQFLAFQCLSSEVKSKAKPLTA